MSERQFRALVDSFLSSQRSDNTKAAYRQDLALFASWCRSNDRLPLRVGTADVARYRSWCEQQGGSDTSIARRLSALRSFFRYAGRDHNPALGLSSPSPHHTSGTAVLEPSEATGLVRAAEQLGDRPALLVRLLLFDGLRLQEVIATDVEDVDISIRPPTVSLIRHGRPATVPLQRPTARAYSRYTGRRTRGPLLLGDDGDRLSRFGADYLLKKAASEAGLDTPISANTLRRHYVASSHAAGASLEDIRHHVGHRDVRTTRRYLYPDQWR
jgi:integrase/recombinase XerD